MKAISHCQRGFLSLYGVSLRGAEREVGVGVAGQQEFRRQGGAGGAGGSERNSATAAGEFT